MTYVDLSRSLVTSGAELVGFILEERRFGAAMRIMTHAAGAQKFGAVRMDQLEVVAIMTGPARVRRFRR